MGIQVELHSAGQRLEALPDPDGGSFDAAGDFDRLIPRDDPAFPLLGQVDPYGETHLGPTDMGSLITEVDRLLSRAKPGPEYRGLMRLRTMAIHCSTEQQQLVFIGD
ncbi:hypothetical protein [Micromonospora sp. WMMD1082]|uniref:hypothetical protein n=1 Tax=Micromonospora sp. WMMD1082 TaxID=3016104 RepID=UPI002417F37F|nr:hypothetical protein [Micromonospora sp. WMMD1082]MDG4798190.1 hypothetical protein [Micromonospora sp. WMMD1082]